MNNKNNPGNLRYAPRNRWIGQVAPRNGFCQFESMAYGLRALSATLFSYRSKYGLQSVREVVSRYAPPSENNTSVYIDFVVDRMIQFGQESGVANIFYNSSTFVEFVRAVCLIESSYRLSSADADQVRHYYIVHI